MKISDTTVICQVIYFCLRLVSLAVGYLNSNQHKADRIILYDVV